MEEDLNHLEASLAGQKDESTPPAPATATLLIITASAGGKEATDFAAMLTRMYVRHLESLNLSPEMIEVSPAGKSGLRSATIRINDASMVEKLRFQAGTHRLTRISPYGGGSKKQTSFATVEVLGLPEPLVDPIIPAGEVRVDTYHAGGPGGQGVNTTDSAVRLTHLPTGIVVTCQNERSKTQNLATAYAILTARLLARQKAEQEATISQQRADRRSGWGGYVRTYNMAGGSYIKDTRSGVRLPDVQRVLDGNLSGLLA